MCCDALLLYPVSSWWSRNVKVTCGKIHVRIMGLSGFWRHFHAGDWFHQGYIASVNHGNALEMAS